MTPPGQTELAVFDGSVVVPARTTAPTRRLGWTWRALSIDAFALLAASFLATVGAERAGVRPPSLFWQAAFPVLVVGLLALRGLYRTPLFVHTLDHLKSCIAVASLAGMVVLTLRVLAGDASWAGPQTARLWLFATAYIVAGRALLCFAEREARRVGEASQPTLVIGAGRVGRQVAHRLLAHPEHGLEPIGYLDKEPLDTDDELRVLGASWDLERVVEEYGVRHVILAFSTAPQNVLVDLVQRCERLGIRVSFVPRFFEQVQGSVELEYLGGLPLVTARPASPRDWQFSVKYAIDRVVGGILILFAAPVMLAAALAVFLSLGRPILFRQQRIGRDKKPFDMLKFRSMRPATTHELDVGRRSIADGLAPGGVEGADRRSRIGALLRDTAIDELPQLFNVLKGEMSLVGPRPERPEFAERFDRDVYRYADRTRVKAGITGWSQVNGLRGQTSVADRAEWDNFYIENFSLWLDAKIILLTGWTVVGGALSTLRTTLRPT